MLLPRRACNPTLSATGATNATPPAHIASRERAQTMAEPQLTPATAADATTEFRRTGGEPAALRDDVQHPERPAVEAGAEVYSRRIGATGETFSLRALSKSEVRMRCCCIWPDIMLGARVVARRVRLDRLCACAHLR